LQPAKVLRSNTTKSLVKGTIALALFTPFLSLSWAHLPDYLLFVGVYYLSVGLYMLHKESTVHWIGDDGIHVKRLWQREIVVPYDNIRDLGHSQGMLARRFDCGTIYVELRQGKGTHRSMTGVSVVQLRDLPDPFGLMEEIAEKLGPFAGAQSPPPDPQPGSR
jgi:hypothetical protein